jgi:hypothetical protein
MLVCGGVCLKIFGFMPESPFETGVRIASNVQKEPNRVGANRSCKHGNLSSQRPGNPTRRTLLATSAILHEDCACESLELEVEVEVGSLGGDGGSGGVSTCELG